jgi:threonylcarbamoyladenosine tRNA methylthiotransferase MtaB
MSCLNPSSRHALRRPGFLIQSLGCKVNQFDAASLDQALRGSGMEPVRLGESPSLIIVQTCTVTSSTDRQNRQLIRSLKAKYPKALLVATGCQAEAFGWSLEEMPEVDLVWGNRHKEALLDEILLRMGMGPAGLSGEELLWGDRLAKLPGRTRAFLKVQDGCDGGCSYCIVPKARGRSRSRSPESISKALALMERAGVQEVVLTGIHLGSYGRDLSPSSSLCGLLEQVLEESSIARIRLSSIEPQELQEGILQLMAQNPRICPHLHVPLQSGSEEVLALMNRPYSKGDYKAKALAAAKAIPDLTLGADLIVGFPGESQDNFQESLGFLESIPWTYLHVFPFSPRPGTQAWDMGPKVSPQEVKRRAALMRELSKQRRSKAMASWVGKSLPVLLERACKERPGWLEGLSHNYFRVAVEAGEELSNSIRQVLVREVREGLLIGVLEEERLLGLDGGSVKSLL